MLITLAGGSGFLGTALNRHFTETGHDVLRLVRGEPAGDGQMQWDPSRKELDLRAVREADVVINLGGAPIAHWPWTQAYKRQILESRVATTTTIAEAIAAAGGGAALINASGINYYGNVEGDRPVTEDSGPGQGFLAEVSRDWEAATEPANLAGARVVTIRTAVVLHKSGGALKTMLLPFRLGLGGRFGDGRQWFPTVSLPDYVSAVDRLATDPQLSGPYNVVAPVAATNGEFTKELGARLHRPTSLPVPAFALKKIVGDLSSELLGSVRAIPKRLEGAGFEFAHPTV
nr:TIGR01777 family protein [Nocardioidaceae bacterium]